MDAVEDPDAFLAQKVKNVPAQEVARTPHLAVNQLTDLARRTFFDAVQAVGCDKRGRTKALVLNKVVNHQLVVAKIRRSAAEVRGKTNVALLAHAVVDPVDQSNTHELQPGTELVANAEFLVLVVFKHKLLKRTHALARLNRTLLRKTLVFVDQRRLVHRKNLLNRLKDQIHSVK